MGAQGLLNKNGTPIKKVARPGRKVDAKAKNKRTALNTAVLRAF